MADFNVNDFINDSKSTLLTPKDYFSSMAKTGGFVEPVIKAVIYSIIAGIISFIWATIGLSGIRGMQGQITTGVGAGFSALIFTIIFGVIVLFIGGLIVLVISLICGGDTNYETNVRATASLMVLFPVSALFSFLAGINTYLGLIVSIIIGLYGLWMFYQALVNALSAKEQTAKIVCIVILVLMAILIIFPLLFSRGRI